MKKIRNIVLVIFAFFTCMISANANIYNTRNDCIADVGGNTNLSTVSTKTTVRSCVQNYCNAQLGTYDTYMIKEVVAYGTCANGNRNPYKIKAFGYNRTGACATPQRLAEIVYTNMDIIYDCTRTSNGSAYSKTTNTTKGTTRATGGGSNTTKGTTSPTKRTGPTTSSKIEGNETTSQTRITTPGEVTVPTTIALTNDASIKKIVINNKFDLQYKEDTKEYAIKVPYSLNDFDVYVETGDPNAKIESYGANSVSSAGGVIDIKVTSSDNTQTNEVKINVSRYTKEEGDCTLVDIFVKNYSLDFSSTKEQYTLKLANNDRFLEIEATPSNPSSIYTIKGNEKLKNNSKIEILVEAVDGTTCTYVITTKKSSKLLLYLLIIVIVGVILFFASKKLKELSTKGKNKYRYE